MVVRKLKGMERHEKSCCIHYDSKSRQNDEKTRKEKFVRTTSSVEIERRKEKASRTKGNDQTESFAVAVRPTSRAPKLGVASLQLPVSWNGT